MTDFHPKLLPRSKRNPHLRRPTIEHPVLGRIEYVNYDGGWWQGSTTVSGCFVRVDVQQKSDVSSNVINAAGEMLYWIQENESKVREHACLALKEGRYFANVDEINNHRLADPKLMGLVRPFMVIIYDDGAYLHYECDALPDGHLFGAHDIQVDIKRSKILEGVFLLARWTESCAARVLEQPIPPGLVDFENCLADRFIVSAASWGDSGLNTTELKSLLTSAIQEVESRKHSANGDAARYLRSVKLVLEDIQRDLKKRT